MITKRYRQDSDSKNSSKMINFSHSLVKSVPIEREMDGSPNDLILARLTHIFTANLLTTLARLPYR
jgi:hypothetical protein